MLRYVYLLMVFGLFLSISSCNFFTSSKLSNQEDLKTNKVSTDSIDALIEKTPKDASLYFARAIKYRSFEEDSLAMRDLRKAISLDSTKANYHSALGDLLFDHKDVNGSLKYIQKALELNPDDEVAHLKMAKLFLFTAEYPKAFVEINTVLRSNVYNPEAYFLKGMCYKNMKDTLRAISSFQTAVQTEPTYYDAHMQLALIFESQKNPLALNYFENAYKANPRNLDALYGKAMYWQNQNNFSEAKLIFNRMIAIDRTYPLSFYNMGWMLLQEDSAEKAIRQFDIAIQVKPDYAEAYYNRGICNEILEKFAQASEDYNQALNFNSNFEECKKAIARVTLKIPKK